MTQQKKQLPLAILILLYVAIFAVCYLGTMLFKYVTHSDMTWWKTAVLMSIIGGLVLLLNRYPGKQTDR